MLNEGFQILRILILWKYFQSICVVKKWIFVKTCQSYEDCHGSHFMQIEKRVLSQVSFRNGEKICSHQMSDCVCYRECHLKWSLDFLMSLRWDWTIQVCSAQLGESCRGTGRETISRLSHVFPAGQIRTRCKQTWAQMPLTNTLNCPVSS